MSFTKILTQFMRKKRLQIIYWGKDNPQLSRVLPIWLWLRDKRRTHLDERCNYRAVEKALQKQQVRVIGNFTQLLDIVTYVHKRSWNSNDALVHNLLRIHGPRTAHRRIRLRQYSSGWGKLEEGGKRKVRDANRVAVTRAWIGRGHLLAWSILGQLQVASREILFNRQSGGGGELLNIFKLQF